VLARSAAVHDKSRELLATADRECARPLPESGHESNSFNVVLAYFAIEIFKYNAKKNNVRCELADVDAWHVLR